MSSYNRRSAAPLILVALGVVLILGSILWIMGAAQTAPQTAAPIFSSPALTPRIPYPNIQRISLADAKAAFELKQAVFIDTRGEPYYSAGHIPGSISMTEEEARSRMGELDRNAWIITYCT
jgi:hypothetical protein